MTFKKSVFVLLVTDEEPKYFQTFEKASRYFEMSGYEEGFIFEVIGVTEISLPPEPEIEMSDKDVKDIEFQK